MNAPEVFDFTLPEGARVFASGRVPDGYNGHIASVFFALHQGITLCVYPFGWFRYHTPPAVDAAEALWLLRHHPSSRATSVRGVSS